MDSEVRGFLFDEAIKRVVLFRTPVEQVLRFLEVPGGESPHDVSPRDGVARLVTKKTGVPTQPDEWHQFCVTRRFVERGHDREGEIIWYWASMPADDPRWQLLRTDRGACVVSVDSTMLGSGKPHAPGLTWVLALAREIARGTDDCPLYEVEEACPRRSP